MIGSIKRDNFDDFQRFINAKNYPFQSRQLQSFTSGTHKLLKKSDLG